MDRREHHGNVCFVNDIAGKPHTFRAEHSVIVQPGSVDEHARPQSRNLDSFPHRICGCAGHCANQRHLLPGQCIHQRGFAAVSGSEERYVESFHERFLDYARNDSLKT